jgi:hypothetical protein
VEILRLVVVGMLIAIVASLGSALYHLASGKGDSGKMVKALTWRISLSIALFVLLLFAWWQGWIQPHDVRPR